MATYTTASDVKVYSKTPKKFFELLINDTDMQVLDPVNHNFVDPMTNAQLFSAAIEGLFTMTKEPTGYNVSFECISHKHFNVIVAVLMDGYWKLLFRLFTGVNKIFCTEFEELYSLGTGKMPEQFKKNTALIICVKTKTLDVNVNLLDEAYGSIHWTPESFVVTENLKVNDAIPFQRIDPSYEHHCPDCLLVTPSGHGHANPCPPVHTASGLRDSIYASTMKRIFQIRFEDCHSVQVLDEGVNRFVHVGSETKLINDIVEGMFSFKTLRGKNLMTFEAAAMKRFCIIFAFWHKDSWRIRQRLVISLTNGLVCFPLTKTMFIENGLIKVPNDYKANTVLLLGIHTPNKELNMKVRVYANNTGKNICTPDFNGYQGDITWDKENDVIRVSDNLLSKNAKKCSFERILYQRNGAKRIVGRRNQQLFVPEPPLLTVTTESTQSLSAQQMVLAPAMSVHNIPMEPLSNNENIPPTRVQVRISLLIRLLSEFL